MQKHNDTRETLREAQHWENRLGKYESAGFCRVCSSQASYGHAVGWKRIRSVCDECRGLTVPGFAGRRAQVWANGESVRTAL